ncbi:ras-specific guanine nucleotide-releasing factor 2-like isoform X2 [Hydractinia symbiolongicarpus]|uniref:ras-specific guanine nucleotide-releasing factor 2-like isoform X2 n=1 Tax=Hydractinia symbiolongicarpus TaxID=13093 RepID=UPI00254E3898|nr:ras-specific guanine nucleotide-releasing factor 2-like isoform X2 [Hydractinia symbiolongicarpus]
MDNIVDQEGFIDIAKRSKLSPTICGCLEKHCKDLKWIQKYYILYQNLLLEFETSQSEKPSKVIPLENCISQRMVLSNKDVESQRTFYLSDHKTIHQISGPNHMYRAKNEIDCNNWIELINDSSYSQLKSNKEELEYRYLHLLRTINSERASKWHLQEFTGEQKRQLDSLRREIPVMIAKKVEEALKEHGQAETDEMKKIKKVQSFVRGVLCRRRWHAIVQDYIRSPHAESMKARNRIVFQLVRSEEEYMECLSILVSGFYRPCKMAASSKHQLITHEEVNSIFLNSETLMFLHQIFLKGLQTRLESWPKIILGDLFDMLLPMLSIYQEYVRNHHYSLQTLTECKQVGAFHKLLQTLEEKPGSNGRTLENFLTYPMHRIPTYIATLQKLLSLTPFDHVERKSLEQSQSVLEELSTVMHDEVSETENIRKNLAIERLFTDGCEFLLDSNEVFIRQGVLLQLSVGDAHKLTRKKSADRRECIQQCFLFSRFLLITSRISGGKLQTIPKGKINLANTTLIEDIVDEDIDLVSVPSSDCSNLAFKLVITEEWSNHKIILMAVTKDEKASWTSDISQCIENLKNPCEEEPVSFQSRRSLLSIRSDSRLFNDDKDIKYSKALDSTRLPRIRHATVQRLLERLLDVRFMTIEFFNTFLTTHTIFTTSQIVLETIIEFYNARKTISEPQINEKCDCKKDQDKWGSSPDINYACKDKPCTNLSVPGYTSNKNASPIYSNSNLQLPEFIPNRRHSSPPDLAVGVSVFNLLEQHNSHSSISSETEAKSHIRLCGGTSPTVNSFFYFPDNKNDVIDEKLRLTTDPKKSPTHPFFLKSPPKSRKEMKENREKVKPRVGRKLSEEFISKKTLKHLHRASLPNTQIFKFDLDRRITSPKARRKEANNGKSRDYELTAKHKLLNENHDIFFYGREEFPKSPKSPLKTPPTPGVVITSSRASQRRSSMTHAAVAFAAATAGATSSTAVSPNALNRSKFNFKFSSDDDGGNIVTKRALKILKHWISKQPETFKLDQTLKEDVEKFLNQILQADDTTPLDSKLANTILRSLLQEDSPTADILTVSEDLNDISCVSEQFSIVQLAEQMTLIDHTLMARVPTREFLSTAWMGEEKEKNAPNLLKAIERFNLTSRLIASEIVSKSTSAGRANVIEKWAMVADACRCLHNFNAVLTIMTAFTSSAIFRLKKTWEKVSKQIQTLIEKLKNMVSAEGRFRNMREVLKCCDPPCVPYLGFYLTDLAFIEESTSMVKDTGLVNFSKMKMVSNIVHEIRFYQTTSYRITKKQQIFNYLLQTADKLRSDEDIYQESLILEQKRAATSGSRIKFSFPFGHN